jgi:hypothetical protein
MPFCPKCGEEVTQEDKYCKTCGENLMSPGELTIPIGEMGATDHLRNGYRLAMEKPMVFVPSLLGGIISILLSTASSRLTGASSWTLFENWGGSTGSPLFTSLYFVGFLVSIIGSIISYVLNFASIDMSRDAYLNQPLDLMQSINYVLKRILPFIVASIIGAIMSITIILIPVVIFMFTILVIDETGIGDAISKAFRVISSNLGDIIVILIVAIIGSIILGIVPFISSLLIAGLNVIIGLSFIDIYFQHKRQQYV